jgi:hypothetical protein
MEFGFEDLQQALAFLGEVLRERGRRYELVVIGGSALLLLGLHIRPTRDLDVLALVEEGKYVKVDQLPTELRQARDQVASALGLGADWLNTGPTSQLDFDLPVGFKDRVDIREYGNLVIHIASRTDQIHFKLYAASDDRFSRRPSKHLADLRRLSPSPDELIAAALWARTIDPSSAFRELLVETLIDLGIEDADGIIS